MTLNYRAETTGLCLELGNIEHRTCFVENIWLVALHGNVAAVCFFRHSPPPGANDEKSLVLGSFTQRCGCYAALHWAIIFRPYGASKWMKGCFSTERNGFAILPVL